MKITKDNFLKKRKALKYISLILALSLFLSLGEGLELKAYEELGSEFIIMSRVLMGKSIEEAVISDIADQVYSGSSITPSVTVKYGSVTLKKGSDYVTYYTDNKSIGKATVTIAGVGVYTGNVKVNFNIDPKKPSLKTPTSKKGGVATLTWDKSSGAGAYEVSYATSSAGTYKVAGTTKELTYTIDKLTTGKTYYVRVRAYKTVDSKKYYSAYSTVRSVKVS